MINRDFTFKIYEKLCENVLAHNFKAITVRDFLKKSKSEVKHAIFRHDVDKNPSNSLKMAHLENKLGIKATYYFRNISSVFNPKIISEIHSLGHEIGYHYEVLASNKGNYEKAIIDFKKNLILFREIVPIETICMHGSPLYKWKDSDLWNVYDFKDYQIIGEAFLSINYE